MTTTDIVEPRHEVAASNILNTHTHGIVREDDAGPIEEVSSSPLQADIAAAIASAELRGRIEGLKIARVLLWTTSQKGSGIPAIAAIDARLASLQPEVAKREEGR